MTAGARSRPRLRTTLAGLTALSALVVVAIAVALAGGGGVTAPPTGAATAVPADALAYVNVSLDRRRSAVADALALAHRMPGYPAAVASLEGRLAATLGISGGPAGFATRARPWIGDEAAVAVLNSPGRSAGLLIVLAVRDRPKTLEFLVGLHPATIGRYRGEQLARLSGGAIATLAGHYLLIGGHAGVDAGLDALAGSRRSLAAGTSFRRATATEPADRVLDAYLSEHGVRRLLVPRGGALGALGTLLDQPSLAAVAAALSPAPGGARAQLHSVFSAPPPAFGPSRPVPFHPTLATQVPSAATLMLEVAGLTRVAPALLAAGAVAGIGGGIGPLLSRLGAALSAQGVDVGAVERLFGGETAVAVTSQHREPALLILARVTDPAAARLRLATLELPLEQLFPPASGGPGAAPEFADHQVDGVTVHQLQLAPGLELDYAVFRHLLAVSTGLAAIESVVRGRGALAGDSAYRAAVAETPDRVTSLLFLDFSQLLRLGEQTGLMRGAGFRSLLPDLERIRAAGYRSTSGKNDSTAELFLQIP